MKTAEPKAKDANVEKCVDLMRSRAYLGLKKYGKTTERTDLTPLEWVRHWQAENADATIYAEKLAQEIEDLTATNARLEAMLAERNDELEVLRKALEGARDSIRSLAVRWSENNGFVARDLIVSLAETLGAGLSWPKTLLRVEFDPKTGAVGVFKTDHASKHAKMHASSGKAAANSLAPDPSSLAIDPSSLTPSEQWHDAQKTPPKVGHSVIGMVNGTTKTRAVYYVAKTGKWVDVNDRPVTVTQWRHL